MRQQKSAAACAGGVRPSLSYSDRSGSRICADKRRKIGFGLRLTARIPAQLAGLAVCKAKQYLGKRVLRGRNYKFRFAAVQLAQTKERAAVPRLLICFRKERNAAGVSSFRLPQGFVCLPGAAQQPAHPLARRRNVLVA